MKANEAPEKIYVHKSQYWELMANEDNITKKGIEYTRTDAFIEKAKKWFENRNEWHDINGIKHCDMEDFEDFRKYMEGE